MWLKKLEKKSFRKQRQSFKLNWWEKFNKIEQRQFVLLALFLITLPLNLFLKWQWQGAYLHGILSDYLLPKFFLFEFFSLAFIFQQLFIRKKIIFNKLFLWIKKQEPLLFIVALIIILRQFFSNQPLASFSWIFHFLLAASFFFLIREDPFFQKEELKRKIWQILFFIVIFQVIIAFYHFSFGRAVFPYHFFGESRLETFSGISQGNFWGREKTLAYGTTAHPNILAGLTALISILFWQAKGLRNKKAILLIFLNFFILFVTQSLSALLTLLLYIVYLFLQKGKRLFSMKGSLFILYLFFLVFLPLALLNLSETDWGQRDSILRRVYLNQAALEMIQKEGVWGVGFNNFTTKLENFSSHREIVRFIQPVHHLFLLVLAEGGLILLFFIFLFLKQMSREEIWEKGLILLAIAVLDHYLLTQALGINLVFLFFTFFAQKKNLETDSWR